MPVPPPPSLTLSALAALDRERPRARKILVAPDINWARELLFGLAWRTGGWIGWEPATLRTIAEELAFADLGASGLRTAGDVELTTLVDEALADVVASNSVGPAFSALASGLGFRKAVRDAVLELRTAGTSAARVREASAPDSPARDLAAVLQDYEGRLSARGLVDPAALFGLALAVYDREARYTLDATLVLAPDLRSAGLPGALAARLLESGARPLVGDAPVDVAPPARTVSAVAESLGVEPWPAETEVAPSPLSWLAANDPAPEPSAFAPIEIELFAASTPTDEIREVLRRAVSEGRRWDEVEIVTTDIDVYGIALDAVCSRAAIRYSSLHGIPLARTRIGRALDRWLGWIGDGLAVDTIREALEAGDLALLDGTLAPTALARELRKLGIGWGRARYESARKRLNGANEPKQAELARLLDALLRVTPEVPERGDTRPVRSSATALARATLGWLELLPLHGFAEARTASRLRARLEDLAAADGAVRSFGTALAELRDALADLRAWTDASDDRKPWSAAGGALHLTDVAHGGTTGRARVFVVGLDADRVSGARVQDPVLTDATREAIDPDALPTTSVRRAERSWALARCLARLRGTVTLSHAVAGEAGDRAVGPGHVMLQALRLVRRDASLDYEALRLHLGTPACAVPTRPVDALDRREVWLAAIADGPMLLGGAQSVRAHHPLLDAGLCAAAEREGGVLCAHHGLVTAAAGLLDPRASAQPISASSLEKLASCPLAWFYRYGLRLWPPEDPGYDAERWLDAMQRGSFLHALYERFGREYWGRQAQLVEPAARERMLEILATLVDEWRADVPPPSEAVFETETAELREAALAFLEAEREAIGTAGFGVWEAFEVKFGEDVPVTLPVGSGVLPVKGIIDRIDRLADRSLRVIDYKTGSPTRYESKDGGPFKGGRHLQAAIYAAAAAHRLGTPVAMFEYRFPTPRGENRAVRYVESDFARTAAIIGGLLDHVVHGHFVPTNDHTDCKYCDYAVVCRVHGDEHKAVSPRAAWAAEHGATHPSYAGMRERRGSAE